MNLLIDATSIQSKRYAGIGQYTENLLAEMIFNPTKETSYILYDNVSYNEGVFEQIKSKGQLNIYKINNFFRSNPFMQGQVLNRIASQYLRRTDKPIYFSPYFLSGFPTNKIPTVITMHDLALIEHSYYSNRGGVFNVIRKAEYKTWLPRTNKAVKIITDAQFTKDRYLHYFPDYPSENIIPIPLGIDMDEKESLDFEKNLPRDWYKKKYLLYMGGGIQKNKNSQGVVKAYKAFLEKLMAEDHSKSRDSVKENSPYLVIAGKIFLDQNTPQSKDLHLLISDLGLKDKVIFTGFYQDSEKYSYLKNCFAFIHLSLYEGFGIAVAEAMRAGIPVIADNHSTYPEVMDDTGILVDGTNEAECGEAIYKIYSDPEQGRRIGDRAKKRSLIFNWEFTAKKTYEVLELAHKESYGD